MGFDTSGAWFEETMASEAGNSTSPAGRLVEFCLRSACRDKHSVAIWRRQRRTLARLPSQLAEPLFHRLLHSHLLTPPLLEYATFGFDYFILFLSLYLKLKNFCRWKWNQSFFVLYFTKCMSGMWLSSSPKQAITFITVMT
jgi:hypothetical protein